MRVAPGLEAARSARIPAGGADLVLGFDILSVTGAEPLSTIRHGRTRVIVNTHEVLIGDFTRDPDLELPAERLHAKLDVAGGGVHYLDATAFAREQVGDPITTNMLMVGYAWQQGLVPLWRAGS